VNMTMQIFLYQNLILESSLLTLVLLLHDQLPILLILFFPPVEPLRLLRTTVVITSEI
jgi:hypothetical protein